MNWAWMEIAFLYDFETSEKKLSWNCDYVPLNKMCVMERVLFKMIPYIFTMKYIPQGFIWILIVSSNNQYETIQRGD